MDKNYMIELLWLWYDYHTEKFDQQLPSYPSPNDEGSVIVVDSYYRGLSDRHASRLWDHIFSVAKFYNVTNEAMEREKSWRFRESTKRRMEKYEWFKENRPEDLSFIDNVH